MKPDHNKARKMQQNYTGCHNNNSHNNVLQLATIVVKLLPHQAAVHKITVQYNALQRHMARPNSKKKQNIPQNHATSNVITFTARTDTTF